MSHTDDPYTYTIIRRLAVEAELDERTIRRFLAGLPIRPRGADRIRAAQKRLGLPPRP